MGAPQEGYQFEDRAYVSRRDADRTTNLTRMVACAAAIIVMALWVAVSTRLQDPNSPVGQRGHHSWWLEKER